jgi:hypothetical protein
MFHIVEQHKKIYKGTYIKKKSQNEIPVGKNFKMSRTPQQDEKKTIFF